MVERTACRFWQVVLQSGLADATALQAWWDAIVPEKRAPDQIDRRLAKQAVQSGALTVWQAQQLLAGRSTGFKIDRYLLLELIGQGGMGRVYLARDTKLNRSVALKILSPERVNNPRAIARFHREAMVGAQLQHENLVRIYDEGEANGKCYLVMEYIEGKNIGQMIGEDGPLPTAVAARLTRQVALGLEHAQRKGLIHRDVNPYNILVTHDGTAKLTDMGLAIDLGDADHVTRDGATVGTFDYVSPEQARHSHSVDTRSDIYSLGCSLYHMLTGQVPFPTASLPEKLFSHQATVPESVRVLAPWVPEGLAEVVARTLRKLAEERYATPLELAQALESYAEDAASTPPEPISSVRPSPLMRAGSEATVTRQFAATPPAAPVVPDDPLNLGINLEAGRSPDAIAPVPQPPLTPTPRVEIANAADGESPLDFGINFNFDGAAAPSTPVGLGINLDAPAAIDAKVNATPTPPSLPKKAAPVRPIAAAAAKVSEPKPMDFAVSFGAEARTEEPMGLGIDLGVPAPRIKAAPEPKTAPRPAVAPPVVAPAALSPTPTPPPSAPPMPTPLVFEAPAEEVAPGGLGLGVNLGSEPPKIRAAPAKTKPKAALKSSVNVAESSAEVKSGTKVAPRGRPQWLVPAAAATALFVVLAGGGFAYRQFTGKPAHSPQKLARGKTPNQAKSTPSEPASVSVSVSKKAIAAVSPTTPVQPLPPPPTGDIAVVARDGVLSVQPNLKDAIRAAIGSKGHVLLRNKSPLVFKAADSLRGAGGLLVIQAEVGIKPVLKVEVKGGTPFLSTRTDAPLKLEGITIEATYVEPGNDPAPIIEAGGAVTLDRCAFRLTSPLAKSRALAVEGASLQADGCWFENFDLALDIAYFSGSRATLRQCMIVRTSTDPKLLGTAALRLRNMPGGFQKTGRRLTLDRCTVRNGGFLDCAGFSPAAPITVEVAGTVVAADFLLTWEPGTTADPRTQDAGAFNPAAFPWTGRDNQYDINSPDGWVRLVATRGAAAKPLPDGPHDFNAWSKRLAETNPTPPPVTFATDPANLSQSASPADFNVSDTGVRPRGADSKFVGPGAKPLSKSR